MGWQKPRDYGSLDEGRPSLWLWATLAEAPGDAQSRSTCSQPASELETLFSVNFKLIVLQYFIPLHDGVPVTLCRRSTSVAHVAVVFSCYPCMSDLLLSRASSAVALALRQSSAERAQAPSTSTGLHRRISRDLSISFPSSIWRRWHCKELGNHTALRFVGDQSAQSSS